MKEQITQIREAGNALVKAVHRYRQAAPTTDENTNAYLAMVNAQGNWGATLAALDKLDAPAKVLNAENADEIARQLFPMQKGMPSWAAGKHRARQQTAADTIVRLRDNGYLAPAKVDVDEAFRVIEQVLDEHGLGVEGNANRVLHDDLRNRLTNLLTQP